MRLSEIKGLVQNGNLDVLKTLDIKALPFWTKSKRNLNSLRRKPKKV